MLKCAGVFDVPVKKHSPESVFQQFRSLYNNAPGQVSGIRICTAIRAKCEQACVVVGMPVRQKAVIVSGRQRRMVNSRLPVVLPRQHVEELLTCREEHPSIAQDIGPRGFNLHARAEEGNTRSARPMARPVVDHSHHLGLCLGSWRLYKERGVARRITSTNLEPLEGLLQIAEEGRSERIPSAYQAVEARVRQRLLEDTVVV